MESISFIQQVFLAGILATAVLDLWQCLLKLIFKVPATNWALVGRWFSYIPQGKLMHQSIGKAEPKPYETITGWIAHYVVGLIYAAVYLFLVWFVFGSEPTIATALGFGAVTVAAPWFLMQPGMGLGVLARNAPSPGIVRTHSLSSHIAFGAGLYVAVLII